ncbi:transcriptional regulator [Desulfovibrio aminophilus]|uniref:transcriptional regulator n=1 Tax=Desulfovibrio aminophilus TaxID=81425 RepID=UPI0033925362
MLIKFLIFAVAAFVVWKLFTGDRKQKQVRDKKQEENLAASGEMVKDPVCGTYVRKDGDIRVRQGEDVHVFCSYECRDKFIKSLEAGQEKAE